MQNQSVWLAVCALCGSILSLSFGTGFARHALFPLLGPLAVTALRTGFSAIILISLWRPWRLALSKSDIKAIMLYGLCLGYMNLSFYAAIAYIPLGITIAIEFTGPLALALLTSRKTTDFLWIALVVIGLFLLLVVGEQHSGLDWRGVVLALMAATGWAAYIVVGHRTSALPAGAVTSLGLLTASFFTLPIGYAAAGSALFSPHVMAMGLLVAVLSSALPYSLELFALRSLPKKTFSTLLSLEPAAGALSGLLILDQQLSFIQWTAILCIIAASMGCAYTASRTSRKTAGVPLPN